MGKIGYVISRVRDMDFKSMMDTAKKVHARSGKNTWITLADMMFCGYKYLAGYMDYYVFEFYKLSGEQRRTYITRGVNNQYVRLLNDPKAWYKLEDKITFNKIFSDFLHRDWIYLKEASPEEFTAFVSGKDRLIAKPVDETCGRGIRLLEKEELLDPAALYDALKAGGQLLVEDYIVQHPDMAKIYDRSVNTIRLVTMLVDGKAHLMFSSIRIGNGKFVDNLNSGGMATVIDPDTGVIHKPAVDKTNAVYEQHPLSGTRLIGYQIPFFKESVALVLEAAQLVPELGYIGWDVAVTKDGPLLIEANHFPGHDIYQFQPHLDNGIGLKPRFDAVAYSKNPVS